jgi:hypothetical protein
VCAARCAARTQFTPGPGSHAITVTNLKSWYSTWANVVMTAGAGVAAPLPLPARPAVLTSATRASPLVQAVRTPEELQVGGVRVCCAGGVGVCAAGSISWRFMVIS